MNVLYPSFSVRRLPAMVFIAALGAAVAGCYGVVHDQISYTISPEYFTRMKFRQFAWADVGLPPRAFASEIGFLATWWVGLVAGWFAARAGLAELPLPERRQSTIRCFGIVLAPALAIGLAGALVGLGVTRTSVLDDWREIQSVLEIENLPAFVVVAYLHGGGYLGAVVGLVVAIIYVRRVLTRTRRSAELVPPANSGSR